MCATGTISQPAIQMFVETAFWFHPLVWWMGKRMMAERERACDEEVLNREGSERRAYADAILSVCRLYVESPLACCSGVTGLDLKKRIEAIMINRKGLSMSWPKKLLLTGAAAVSIALPIAIGVALGVVNLPVRAQTPAIRTVTVGRFHQALTGIEFTVPPGRKVQYEGPSSGSGEQIGLDGDASLPPVDAFVYLRPETDDGESLHDKLIASMHYKAGQNSSDETYKMLPNTRIEKTVSGHPALSVRAAFVQNGVKMIHYNTWVWAKTSHVYISARMKADDFPVIRQKIDQMAGTFLVP